MCDGCAGALRGLARLSFHLGVLSFAWEMDGDDLWGGRRFQLFNL